jgi:hypothetical protein
MTSQGDRFVENAAFHSLCTGSVSEGKKKSLFGCRLAADAKEQNHHHLRGCACAHDWLEHF